MEYLPPPVVYLDNNDFDDKGNIVLKSDMPVFIMIQAVFCHHCTTAKPEFYKLSKEMNNKIIFATIQGDSNKDEVVALKKKIKNICPNFYGFPSYVLHHKGKKIPYDGNRQSKALKEFLEKNL